MHSGSSDTGRAGKYLSRMEPAISGSGGRAATFKAALAMVKGFDLGEEDALPLLREWNQGCSPPWSERELRAVIRDAGKADRPAGYLLGGSRQGRPADEAEVRRQKRLGWPAMRLLESSEMRLVASLRHVGVGTVELLRCHGFLWRARWRDQDVFLIRNGMNGTFCQARRMDGEPFQHEGRQLKALNLPGSEGRFLCPGGLGAADVPVLLIEGAVGLLEATEFILRAGENGGRLKPAALLAAVSASARFEDTRLERLRGRRVLILADPDAAGRDAAAAWSGQLAAVDCSVRTLLPPDGCRDFGSLLRTAPASDPVWSAITRFDPDA